MWKASVGIPTKPKTVEDDDWETDPDFVNNVTEQEQRWGSKTIEGSGRTAGSIDMAKLREETTKANDLAKEKQKAEQPNASYGYGGKFGVEKDRMDSSAVGHDYIGKVAKHVSQKDYSTGFGGKFGVQTDRVDKSAVSWNHKEKIEKHASQKDYSSGFGGKFGVERDRQDKSAVGWDYNEKPQKHDSQSVTKTNAAGEKSQKPSELKAKFERLAQKEEPPKPLGKPKSVTQRWPPVNSSTIDPSPVKNAHPVSISSSAPKAESIQTPIEAAKPTPTATIAPIEPTQTPVDAPVFPANPPEICVLRAPDTSLTLNKQTSEEEWETGRDNSPPVSSSPPTFSMTQREHTVVIPAPVIKHVEVVEEKREESVVVQQQEQGSVIDEDLAERVMREEMALREQLAQEMNADEYDQDVESTFTAIALYDYQAAADDEISFDPDETITNIEMIDEGWWRGTCRGHTGLFPANYVQLQE